MHPLRFAPVALLAAVVCVHAAEDPLVDQAFAILVDGAGEAPRKAVLSFEHEQPHLSFAGEAAQPLTYRAERRGDGSAVFTGTVAGQPIHGTAVGDEVKGEIGAGAALRTFAGAKQVEAAVLLERGRELQLERRPREAIEVYVRLVENHRMELDYSAPALIYLVECFQLLQGDAEAEARYHQLAGRYLSQPPPLDGVSRLTLERAREDLQLMPWKPEVPAGPDRPGGASIKIEVDTGAKKIEPPPAGWHWSVGAEGEVSSIPRIDGSLEYPRERHTPFDALASAELDQVSYLRSDKVQERGTLALTAGTDRLAADPGEPIAELAYDEGIWSRTNDLLFCLTEIGGGRSRERGWLCHADAMLGLAHLAADRDDLGWTYRYGLAVADLEVGEWLGSRFAGRLGIDRIVDEKGGSRHLATETYLRCSFELASHWSLILGGSYCHAAVREDGSRAGIWQGQIGLAWRFGGGF